MAAPPWYKPESRTYLLSAEVPAHAGLQALLLDAVQLLAGLRTACLSCTDAQPSMHCAYCLSLSFYPRIDTLALRPSSSLATFRTSAALLSSTKTTSLPLQQRQLWPSTQHEGTVPGGELGCATLVAGLFVM